MNKEQINTNPVLKLSFEFSLQVIQYCEQLEAAKKFIISRQLLRSGTSIAANLFESQNAESAADFIHKMKVAGKEVDETTFWLILCEQTKGYPPPDQLMDTITAIGKLIGKIIATTRKRMKGI